MRADRLVAILLLLLARGRMTAAALAAELEVSVRTIYRDLEALGRAGVPVYAEAGPGGGCRLLDGYRSALTGLSSDEAAALLALGVPSPLRDLGLGGFLGDAHLKVIAALPSAQREAVRAATGRFHLDTPAWFRPAEPVAHLPALAEAVRDERRVRLRYRPARAAEPGGGRQSSRTVDPLGIVHKAGRWYLVAGARRGPTVFRVSRIRRMTVLDEGFTRPPGFDLPAFWASWSREFEEGLPRIPVTVRVSGAVFPVLPEVFGDAVRPALEAATPPDPEGWRTLQLTFESPEAARYRLLGFGAEVEVVGPSAIREAVATAAARTARRYRDAEQT